MYPLRNAVNDSKLVSGSLCESIQAYYGVEETTVTISSTAYEQGSDLLTSTCSVLNLQSQVC